MGQTCCGGTPEGHELNNKISKPTGELAQLHVDDQVRTL